MKKGDYKQFFNLAHYPSLHRKWGYIIKVYPDGFVFRFEHNNLEMFVRKSEIK